MKIDARSLKTAKFKENVTEHHDDRKLTNCFSAMPSCLIDNKLYRYNFIQVNHYRCFHLGNDATSIPSQCCVYPYILNGGLYYNCTVYTPFSNDFGCYHSNGQWITCEQPEGMFRPGAWWAVRRYELSFRLGAFGNISEHSLEHSLTFSNNDKRSVW